MPTKGSMVEYLPVGSQEAPQTIIAKKISSSEILNYTPSPLCSGVYALRGNLNFADEE